MLWIWEECALHGASWSSIRARIGADCHENCWSFIDGRKTGVEAESCDSQKGEQEQSHRKVHQTAPKGGAASSIRTAFLKTSLLMAVASLGLSWTWLQWVIPFVLMQSFSGCCIVSWCTALLHTSASLFGVFQLDDMGIQYVACTDPSQVAAHWLLRFQWSMKKHASASSRVDQPEL